MTIYKNTFKEPFHFRPEMPRACVEHAFLIPFLLLGNEKRSELTEEMRNGKEEGASLGSFRMLNQMEAGSHVIATAFPWEGCSESQLM